MLEARRLCGGRGWRYDVALDAALVDVGYAKRGRGNVDVHGVGIRSAMRRQAKALHVSLSTIEKNVRIFNTFFKNGVTCYDNLLDKTYFLQALRTSNPKKTIRYFDEQVKKNPEFFVTNAKRYADQQRIKREKVNQSAVSGKNSPLENHILWAKKEILRIKAMCPDRKFGERFYAPLLEDLDDHLSFMAEKNAESLCRMAWDRGYHREAQIAESTALDRKTVAAAMLRLSDAEEFWEVKESTHGHHDKRWQKSGVPLGSTYVAPEPLRKVS